MKKIILISFFISNIYASCGGCTDAGVETTLSNESKTKYEEQEKQIHSAIEKLNNIIKDEIIKTEFDSEKIQRQLIELSKFNYISSVMVSPSITFITFPSMAKTKNGINNKNIFFILFKFFYFMFQILYLFFHRYKTILLESTNINL